MWRTMVCPLFNALLVLLYYEGSEANYKQAERLWYQTFKDFMMIPQSTSNALIEEMIGIDLKELGKLNAQNSARKRYVRSCRMVPKLLKQTKPIDYLKGVPKEWCLYLNSNAVTAHCARIVIEVKSI